MPSTKIQNCIDLCNECARTCLETITHCLQKGGKHVQSSHVTMLTDCATLCEASAHLMINESPFQEQLCGLCAEICNHCAKECNSFQDDSQMKDCAAACKACATACKEMAPVRKVA